MQAPDDIAMKPEKFQGSYWDFVQAYRAGEVDGNGNPITSSGLSDDDVDRLLSGDFGPLNLTAAGINKDGSEHTGAMIALLPTQSDMDRLYVIGGEEDEELHVTLEYLGEAAKIPPLTRDRIVESLMRYAQNIPIIDADLFGIATFNEKDGEKETCVVGLVTGEELARAKKRICMDLEDIMYDAPSGMPEQHTPWIPHITLAYTNDGTLAASLGDREGPVRFDRVRVAFGGEVTDIPLYDGTASSDTVSDYDEGVTASYNEAEHPRDAHGRWSSIPGEAELKKLTKRFSKAKSGDKAYKSVTSSDAYGYDGPGGYGGAHADTIEGFPTAPGEYQRAAFLINKALRTKDTADWKADDEGWVTGYKRQVHALDQVFTKKRSRLKNDLMVERGVIDPHKTWGDAWSDEGSNVGLSWIDGGFTSTTIDHDIATHFSGEEHAGQLTGAPVVMRILVPEGTSAMTMGKNGTHREFDHEKEVLLPRNAKFRIIADYGEVDGIRKIDVELTSVDQPTEF